MQRPRRRLFRCRVALPREICLSPLHASFEGQRLSNVMCQGWVPINYLPASHCETALGMKLQPSVGGRIAAGASKVRVVRAHRACPTPSPPLGATRLIDPPHQPVRRAFFLTRWNTGAQEKFCPRSKLFPSFFCCQIGYLRSARVVLILRRRGLAVLARSRSHRTNESTMLSGPGANRSTKREVLTLELARILVNRSGICEAGAPFFFWDR